MRPDLLTGGLGFEVMPDDICSSGALGPGGGAVGVDSEGFAAALVLFLTGGFLVTSFSAGGEGSVASEGSWSTGVD